MTIPVETYPEVLERIADVVAKDEHADEAIDLRNCAKLLRELVSQKNKLIEACKAGVRYDSVLERCANDPQKMGSFCTVQNESLDDLYADWISKINIALDMPIDKRVEEHVASKP